MRYENWFWELFTTN